MKILTNEITRIHEIMGIKLITEVVVVSPLVRLIKSLITDYGDDSIRLLDDQFDNVLLAVKNGNPVADDVAEQLLKHIDWGFLVQKIFTKMAKTLNDEATIVDLAVEYIKRAIGDGYSIDVLKNNLRLKYERSFPTFNKELLDEMSTLINKEIDMIYNNKEIMNKLIINLNLDNIIIKLPKGSLNILEQKGFDETFKPLAQTQLTKLQKNLIKAQAIIDNLNSPIVPSETKVLYDNLENIINDIRYTDKDMLDSLVNWINKYLNDTTDSSLKLALIEYIKTYKKSSVILGKWFPKWGLQEAWVSALESYAGITRFFKKSNFSGLKRTSTTTLDVLLGRSFNELKKSEEGWKKIYNFTLGTRRTLAEYRQLAAEIGVPRAVISYASEAVIFKNIILSGCLTILEIIRDVIGAALNLYSTDKEAWNDFWDNWEAQKGGIIGLLGTYISKTADRFYENLKLPGTMAKMLFGYLSDVIAFIDKILSMDKETMSRERIELVNSLIRRTNEEINTVVQEVETQIETRQRAEPGTLEHFKETYDDENSKDLGGGRFQHSDGTIFKWDGTLYKYE